MTPVEVDAEKAKEILRERWEEISREEPKDFVKDKKLSEVIRSSVNSKTKLFRYAILTQVLAKVANSSADCRCLQVKRGGLGAFDARSFCKKVVVEFDRENDSVIGQPASGDPYVSKPLRHKEFSERYRNEIKDREGWDALCFILGKVEEVSNPDFTRLVLDQILLEIKRRLSRISITYPTPRLSLEQMEGLIREYLSKPSEGARLEVVAYSLFRTLGEIFDCYDEVFLSKTTAPNLFMGRVANIECYLKGRLVKAVEPKDRELTKGDVEEALRKIRGREVSEFLFLTGKGVKADEKEEVEEIIRREFKSGRNIYIADPG
jgi:hypothetical protein